MAFAAQAWDVRDAGSGYSELLTAAGRRVELDSFSMVGELGGRFPGDCVYRPVLWPIVNHVPGFSDGEEKSIGLKSPDQHDWTQ